MKQGSSRKAVWLFMVAAMTALVLALAGCSHPVENTKTQGTGTGTTGDSPATIDETQTTKVKAPSTVTVSYPNGVKQTTTYTYTNMGFVASQTLETTGSDLNGKSTTTYAHSEDGLISGVTYAGPDGSSWGATVASNIKHENNETEWTEEYHFNGVQPTDPSNAYYHGTYLSREITYEIDPHGHLLDMDNSTIYSINGQNRESSMDYTFDEQGRITSFKTEDEPEGEQTATESLANYTYIYQGEGADVTVTVKSSLGEESVYRLTYDGDGNLVKIENTTHGSTTEITYTDVEADTLAAAYIAILPATYVLPS